MQIKIILPYLITTLSYHLTSSYTSIVPYQCFIDGNSKSVVEKDREKKRGFAVTKATSLFQLADDCPHIAEVSLSTFLILIRTQNIKKELMFKHLMIVPSFSSFLQLFITIYITLNIIFSLYQSK